ncbi:YbjN domain-containing protein [Sphingosinicella rhizophila]|uniref:YbjN domain-containing protein n=1 Tax=Sphingosinicella rhizophila TaxID=3050082 RepID=A0ABU3Q3P3_9SPHN|nr:YbjN domain-containing protein [Sphingosinicella sp. GR2756]MDT9597583.1 YbjN domain-containing protein [Sphingosinicella sp. GR2756]
MPILLSFVAAAAAAQFNPAAPDNRQIIAAFNYGSLEAVLTSIGARHQRTSTNAARPELLVTFSNDRRAVVTLLSCNATGTACKALGIQSSWERPPGVTPQAAAEAAEQFNRRYSFAKAYVTTSGRLALQRYLTADYGFIRGNLAVNLLVFASQADRFANDVVKRLETPAK